MRLRIVFSSVVCLAASGAFGQNPISECGCDRFLSSALMTERTDFKREERTNFEKQLFCYASEETVKDVYNSYTTLGIAFPEFLSADLKSGYSADKLRAFRNQSCAAAIAESDWLSILSSFQKFAPAEMFSTANKCLENCTNTGGLYCALSSIDVDNVGFFARWRPRDTIEPAKLRTLTVTGGQLITSSTLGIEPSLVVGMEIPPGGLSAPIRRNGPYSTVRVSLNTDHGACVADQGAHSTEFKVNANIVASGTITLSQSKHIQSPQHDTEGDCGADISGFDTYCFDENNVRAISIGNLYPESNRCATDYAPEHIGVPSANCARVHWHVHGCGYDWYGPVKNCKGNGTLRYGGTLTGEKEVPVGPVTFSQNESLRLLPNGEGSVSFQFPMAQTATWRNKSFSTRVVIVRVVNGEVFDQITLDNNVAAKGGAVLTFDPQTGLASVSVKNVTLASQ